MKNLKKLLAVLLVVAMITTTMVTAFAAEAFSYETEAKAMYDIGLYKGESKDTYVPNLGGALDRQTGAIMILRIFGLEDDALAMEVEDAYKALKAKFVDGADVQDWAARQVAYCVEKGYIKGIEIKLKDGKVAYKFDPKGKLNGKAYSSLVLQLLGYNGEFTYAEAAKDLAKVGGLTDDEAAKFNTDAALNRDSMVGISFGALKATLKVGGKTLLTTLVESGVVDKAKAAAAGFPVLKITKVEALKDVNVKIGDKPVLPEKVKVTFEDNTTADVDVTWPTVDTTKAGTVEVKGLIKAYASEAAIKVVVMPDELTVTGVETNNYKEIIVKFTGPVDSDKAAKAANYVVKVGSTDKGVAVATVAADKTSVALTLTNALGQQDKVDVTVKKDAGIAADVTKTIDSVVDSTLPVAESIKLTGPNSFEITFSEPVEAGASAEVLVKNGIYGVVEKTLSANGKVLSVKLGLSTLSEGKYDVKVSNYKDFAGFNILSKSFELDYVKDTAAPVAKLVSANQTEVVIEFNKAVTKDDSGKSALTKEYFNHTYTGWNPIYVGASADKKTYTLYFKKVTINNVEYTGTEYFLPEGNVVITVLKSANEVAVVDSWGNKMAEDAKLVAAITVDKTAPEVTKVEATAEDKLELTFSESLVQATAETEANYVIKDSNSKEIETSYTASYDDTKKLVTIQFGAKLSGGKYTIEVKDLTDNALSANKIVTITKEFVISDLTAVDGDSISVTYVSSDNEKAVYVTYDEDMTTSGEGSILDKNNYRLNGAVLPDAATIALFGSNKKVKIALPSDFNFDTDNVAAGIQPGTLTIGQVKDLAGNKPSTFAISESILEESAPTIYAVTTKALDKIEIDIRGKVTTVPSNGFTITVGDSAYELGAIETITYAIDSDDQDREHTYVVAVMRSQAHLADASKVPAGINVVADKVKSDTGKAMVVASFTNVTDGIAPAFKAPTTDAGKKTSAVANGSRTITLTFDEAVKAVISPAVAATDLVVTYDGKALVAGNDYTLAFNGADVVVTITKDMTAGKKVKVATKSTVNYITDEAGTVAKTFEQEYTVQ